MISHHARILSVGTANPPDRYEQKTIPELFGVNNPRIRSLFSSSHIQSRNLYLPEPTGDGVPVETQTELIQKHRRGALDMGVRAIEKALSDANLSPEDIDYFCCITTSGFLCPGLTAILMKDMGFREDCSRADIVGMGCHAGLNAMATAAHWAEAHPGMRCQSH